jgi:hypothetical protein
MQMSPAANSVQSAPLAPPAMNWALLLIVDIVTIGVFAVFWSFVQARYAGKAAGSRAVRWYLASLVLLAPIIVLKNVYETATVGKWLGLTYGLLSIACELSHLVGTFSIKHALERCYSVTGDSGRQLGGMKTLFFGQIYLQYHMGRLAKMIASGR